MVLQRFAKPFAVYSAQRFESSTLRHIEKGMITMLSKEQLKDIPRSQLEVMVNNKDYVIDILRDRLFLITGCREFGGQDGTNGGCVECFYNTPDLHNRCCLFQMAMHSYIVQKHSQEATSKCGVTVTRQSPKL